MNLHQRKKRGTIKFGEPPPEKEVRNDKDGEAGIWLPRFFLRIFMEFEQFKFVYVETDYLKALHEVDGEISFDEKGGYENKPHLGILITDNKYRYVMPLTSAKEKHKKWRDITSTNYRVYEVIDIRTAKTDKDDIIVN